MKDRGLIITVIISIAALIIMMFAIDCAIYDARAKIDTLKSEIAELKSEIDACEIVITVETVEETTTCTPEIQTEPVSLGTFKITAYCHCEKCCGKSDGITASGARVTANQTIAVDPNIIPLGSEVMIDDQVYIAEDTGGAIKGNRIDMYFPTHEEALNFGVQYIEVILLEEV